MKEGRSIDPSEMDEKVQKPADRINFAKYFDRLLNRQDDESLAEINLQPEIQSDDKTKFGGFLKGTITGKVASSNNDDDQVAISPKQSNTSGSTQDDNSVAGLTYEDLPSTQQPSSTTHNDNDDVDISSDGTMTVHHDEPLTTSQKSTHQDTQTSISKQSTTENPEADEEELFIPPPTSPPQLNLNGRRMMAKNDDNQTKTQPITSLQVNDPSLDKTAKTFERKVSIEPVQSSEFRPITSEDYTTAQTGPVPISSVLAKMPQPLNQDQFKSNPPSATQNRATHTDKLSSDQPHTKQLPASLLYKRAMIIGVVCGLVSFFILVLPRI
jgi:hypothetical protein